MKNTLIITAGLLAAVGTFSIHAEQPTPTVNGLNIGAILERIDWDLDVNGLGGQTEADDQMGRTLVSGDFNNDGHDDLAIGIPYEDFFFGALTDSGAVIVIYGTLEGLSTSNRQFLYQPPDASMDGVEDNDRFGWSLASGDFDGDGYDDLAVGSPFEDVDFAVAGNVVNGGIINIFYGNSDGLNTESITINQQTGTNNPGTAFVKTNDRFGWSLAAGDFNDDGYDELVVGVPYEDFGNMDQVQNGGQIEIYAGSEDGIVASNRDSFSQNAFGIEGNSESQDRFGWALASGYFDDDSYADLAIGVYGETVDGDQGAGAVQIFYGGNSGITSNDEIISQEGDISGVVEAGDNFGYSVAAGDFDNDGYDDLLIGAHREDVNSGGNITDAGAVHIIYGSVGGITDNGNQIFTQNTNNLEEAEQNDQFGSVVAVGDVDYDGYDDAIIGVPNEHVLGTPAGAIHVLFGSENGVTTANDIYDFTGFPGDNYGRALSTGNFGNGERLAVGVPGDDSEDSEDDSGSVVAYRFFTDIIFKNGLQDD